jgi:hypothetical protein
MWSLLGSGLFRGSTSWVCEEVGVALAEPAGDWFGCCEEGEAVPDLSDAESLPFLDDDDFVGSLALESCLVGISSERR